MPTLDIPTERRRPVLVGAVVVALLIGLGAWRLLPTGSAPQASPGEVVSEFFLAQREGDCERLLELLSEASWSDGGERSREEFLEQCPGAIAGYEPSIDRVRIDEEYENPDRVLVTEYGAYYEDGDAGHLVREDGEWKVETDERTLRIGPAAEKALHGYLEAYADGDCEAITTYVTEPTWSKDGTLERDEFLERCEAVMEQRSGSPATGLGTETVSVSYHGAGDALATVSLPGLDGQAEVSLVKEDLRWRVRGDEGIPGAPAGTFLHPLRYAEVRTTLVSHPTVERRTCHNFTDSVTSTADTFYTGMPRPPKGLAADLSVSRTFSSCYAAVTLYEFAEAETARRAATRLADELMEWERSTVKELVEFDKEYGIEVDIAENKRIVREERPNRRIDVAGYPTAIGVRTGCDVEGCGDVAVLLAHDNRVIGAYSQIGDLDQAVQLLAAQLEEL